MNLGNLLLKVGFQSMLRIEAELRTGKMHSEGWGGDIVELMAEFIDVRSEPPIFHRGVIEQKHGMLNLLVFEGREKENLTMLHSQKFDGWESLERFLLGKTSFRRGDFKVPANLEMNTDGSAADYPTRQT